MTRRGIVVLTLLGCLSGAAGAAAEEVPLLGSGGQNPGRLISVDALQGVGLQAAAMKEAECLRAFGQPALCACLARSLPVQVSLADYLRVAGLSAGELHERRKGHSPVEQQLIDQILASRQQCLPPAP